VSETDRFDRLLRYVYLESGEMANELLVIDGYAQVSTFPPDVKYQERFLAAQQQAVASGAGLWSACVEPEPTSTQVPVAAGPTATPAPVSGRGSACPQGCASPPVGCVIKGKHQPVERREDLSRAWRRELRGHRDKSRLRRAIVLHRAGSGGQRLAQGEELRLLEATSAEALRVNA